MAFDDAVILTTRLLAMLGFGALLVVVLRRVGQTSDSRTRKSRLALLCLWTALTYVSLYATLARLFPEWFAWLNQSVEWGPLSVALIDLVAAIVSCWAYLWRRQ